MPYRGKCYCGEIEWKVIGKVDFTSNCHCTDCQAVSGSAYGTMSLMIYDHHGVEFSKGTPKVIRGFSDDKKTTQRGFCPDCGSVLFNHVSEGNEDEHWAMRTGCLIGDRPKPEKEIFMKSKPGWVPPCQKPENRFEGMPGA